METAKTRIAKVSVCNTACNEFIDNFSFVKTDHIIHIRIDFQCTSPTQRVNTSANSETLLLFLTLLLIVPKLNHKSV